MTQDQKLRAAEHFFHQQIPITRALGIAIDSYDAGCLVVTAPLALNHNHLGTAFGGSLAAIATLAAYGLLWLELDDPRCHLIISQSTVRFRLPVRRQIQAICQRPDPATWETFETDYRAKSKGQVRLRVTIEEDDQTAVEFWGTFVASRASTGAASQE